MFSVVGAGRCFSIISEVFWGEVGINALVGGCSLPEVLCALKRLSSMFAGVCSWFLIFVLGVDLVPAQVMVFVGWQVI